jgi:hypothetical protein
MVREEFMPASNALVRTIVPAVIGVVIGAGAVTYLHRNDVTSAAGARTSAVADVGGAPDDLATLKSDVARLKANAPSQSHSMADVGYHWSNLWFAAEKKNWPLAQFYFGEARDHILWTIRLRPVRKGPDGSDVNLMPIFEGIDTSAFKDVIDAIQAQDSTKFAAAYRETLQACYGCHKSAGLPSLKPMVPTVAGQPIINVDASATFPQ